MTNTQTPCYSHLPELTEDQHNRLASMFRLLGDEGRLRMVVACIDEPKTVSQLAGIALMSQPLASHHLRQLREARLLKPTRAGKQVLYELNDYFIRHVILDLAKHVLKSESGE